VRKFFKVDLAGDGWGLLVNEGTAEEPKFRVLFKGGSERWMEHMASDLNKGNPEAEVRAGLVGLAERRHD
jgi:hypothetical protein